MPRWNFPKSSSTSGWKTIFWKKIRKDSKPLIWFSVRLRSKLWYGSRAKIFLETVIKSGYAPLALQRYFPVQAPMPVGLLFKEWISYFIRNSIYIDSVRYSSKFYKYRSHGLCFLSFWKLNEEMIVPDSKATHAFSSLLAITRIYQLKLFGYIPAQPVVFCAEAI